MKGKTNYSKIALDNKRKPKDRIIAIHRIKNERVLYKIAMRDSNPSIRLEAVKEITKDSYLKSIARYDEKMQVRIAAVQRIKSQYLLYKIVKSKKYDGAIRSLAKRLQKDPLYIQKLKNYKLNYELYDFMYIKS